MPSSSAVVRSLFLAGLCLGSAQAYAQEAKPAKAQPARKTTTAAKQPPKPAPKPVQKPTMKAAAPKAAPAPDKTLATTAVPTTPVALSAKAAAPAEAAVATAAAATAGAATPAKAGVATAAEATAMATVAVMAKPAPPPPRPPGPGEVRPSLPPAKSNLLPVTLASASVTPKGETAASIAFESRSAELSDGARAQLDRIAKDVGDKHVRQIELCAFASGVEPDNRQIALARALLVRGYLLERGVMSQIEVSGFASDSERVDIVVPST